MSLLLVPCAVCGAPQPLLRFYRRTTPHREAHRRMPFGPEACLTFRCGDAVELAPQPLHAIRLLCDAHHAVWESSPLARRWLERDADVYALNFTARQFERFARTRGLRAGVLKKRLLRDAEQRTASERRKHGRHDWATVVARAKLFDEMNPWAKAAMFGLGAYAIMGFMRRAA
jgi:hypothetical protein